MRIVVEPNQSHPRAGVRGRGDRAAVLVEFALVLPLLIILLLGTITAGLALNAKQQINHAIREGSRYAATVPADPPFSNGATWAENVRDLVVERSGGDLSAADVCVSLVSGSPGTVVPVASAHSTAGGAACIAAQTYPVTPNDEGLRVQVTATKPQRIQLGVFGFIPATVKASATAQAEGTL